MSTPPINQKFPTFAKRLTAWLADSLILGIIIFLARITLFTLCVQINVHLAAGKVAMISLAIGVAIAFAYHVFFEGSKFQATPGKIFLGLTVTDIQGRQISKSRALARHVSKYVSVFSFGIGYFLFLVSKKKQCLHDMIAKCVVVQTRANS
jgi:uncharacterized RDD family membrane protein YckC